jgi:hypothetical protein
MWPSGMWNKRSTCVGCDRVLCRTQGHHKCTFAMSGFMLGGQAFLPCGTVYHLGCIQLGEPFRTHLPADKGLIYPAVGITPNFVCEACTVHAVLHRELTRTTRDHTLLMLERMRMIDVASAWDPKTLAVYQSHLRQLQRFELFYGVSTLCPTPLERPPVQRQFPSCGPSSNTHWRLHAAVTRHREIVLLLTHLEHCGALLPSSICGIC